MFVCVCVCVCVCASLCDLPDSVVHPGHGEVGCQVGCVGGTHDECEEPPAAHNDPQCHRAHHVVTPYREREEGWDSFQFVSA